MSALRLTPHNFSFFRVAGLAALGTVVTFLVLSNSVTLWDILLVCAVVAAMVGPRIYRSFHHNDEMPPAEFVDVRINSTNIPIQGGLGAGLIIAFLFTLTLVELPALRWLALPGLGAGLVVGAVLVWRRNHGSN